MEDEINFMEFILFPVGSASTSSGAQISIPFVVAQNIQAKPDIFEQLIWFVNFFISLSSP